MEVVCLANNGAGVALMDTEWMIGVAFGIGWLAASSYLKETEGGV